MKIAIVTSSPMTIHAFLRHQIMCLSRSHQVTGIVNDIHSEISLSDEISIFRSIKIVREVSPFNDICAFFSLLKLFRNEKFDLVYSVTPKPGLLAMTASYLAKTPCRIHIFTGQVWVTRTGFSRYLLKKIDYLISKFATHILADSKSQKHYLINEKIVNLEKINVIENGSISGVNLERFRPDINTKSMIRNELKIADSEVVILFLGRLSRDKGIMHLVNAFMMLSQTHTFVRLMIVGPDEGEMMPEILTVLGNKRTMLSMIEFTKFPEHYMNAADILCLPSYREGFGSVVIEAAAVGIPAVGSDIYGIRDSIQDGITGILFPAGNTQALYDALHVLIVDKSYRKKLGLAAYNRARNLFSQDQITAAYIDYFEEVMSDNIV